MASGVWERDTFTVPVSITEEQVSMASHKYMRKFCECLEAQGFTVKSTIAPKRSERLQMMTPPDRKRYDLWAFVTRAPVKLTLDIPDRAVPELERVGMKLIA